MKARYQVQFDDAPTLGEMLDALTTMRDSGAPMDAELLPTFGDKGTQRDPWPFIRGMTAAWEV